MKGLVSDVSRLNIVLTIEGNTSPDGDSKANLLLSKNRAHIVLEYIRQRVAIPDSLIHIEADGIDWERLAELSAETRSEGALERPDSMPQATILSADLSSSVKKRSADREPLHRLALKTNLLYDAILMPSLELEYRIGNRWSVNLEARWPGGQKTGSINITR